jgi:hypothetical protein
MQLEIISETFFEGWKRAAVALRLGISVKTYDNRLQAAFGSLRHRLTQDAEVFTEVDRSLWFDRIEELRESDSAARLRRASGKTGDRCNFEGDRSNFEGDPSNSRGDAEKNARARDDSVAVTTKS